MRRLRMFFFRARSIFLKFERMLFLPFVIFLLPNRITSLQAWLQILFSRAGVLPLLIVGRFLRRTLRE